VPVDGRLRDPGTGGHRFGVGGKQILVEDPSGNPIELFEPTVTEASLSTR
jgi:hypothetical protein